MMKNIIKRIASLLVLTLCIGMIFAQDTLTYMDGSTMQVSVLDIDDSNVVFNLREGGSALKVSKMEIFKIQYENGDMIVLDHTDEKAEEILGYDDYQYSGPKVGLTYLGPGSGANFLEDRGYNVALISQFGWQFETRIFTLENQTSGLLEWIVLAGGLEKGLFLPSASMIFGIRSGKNGMEVGLGPNLSVSGFGMAFAAGGSIPYGKINIPVNLALIPSINKRGIFDFDSAPEATGFRLSMLVGFNTRVH